MSRITPAQWAERSDTLRPKLFHKNIVPVQTVVPVKDESVFQGWRMQSVQPDVLRMDTGDVRSWDFGRHMVGYLSFRVSLAGTRQDAPVKLRITFGEMPCELAEPFSDYHGWISAAWLQEETIILDRIPKVVSLPRRYAFRYVKIDGDLSWK